MNKRAVREAATYALPPASLLYFDLDFESGVRLRPDIRDR